MSGKLDGRVVDEGQMGVRREVEVSSARGGPDFSDVGV